MEKRQPTDDEQLRKISERLRALAHTPDAKERGDAHLRELLAREKVSARAVRK